MKRWVLLAIGLLIIVAQLVGCSSIKSLVKGDEVSNIKEKLELGMTKDEVKQKFGRSYTSVRNVVDGSEVWRFDAVNDTGYKVPTAEGHGSSIQYDQAGFSGGKLLSQLFVGWSKDNRVKDAVLYYRVDGNIHEYRVSE